MKLSKILAISGKPGLYEMVSQTKNGFIVQSFSDGRRFPVFAHERVSALEEISIFSTSEDDIPLKDIFKMINDKHEGGKSIDHKSDNAALKAYFDDTIEGYDSERVYVSDMKKVINWYNLLHDNELLDFTEEVEEEEEKSEEQKEVPDETTKESKETE